MKVTTVVGVAYLMGGAVLNEWVLGWLLSWPVAFPPPARLGLALAAISMLVYGTALIRRSSCRDSELSDRVAPALIWIGLSLVFLFLLGRWRFQAQTSHPSASEIALFSMVVIAEVWTCSAGRWAPVLKPRIPGLAVSQLTLILVFASINGFLSAVPALVPRALPRLNPSLLITEADRLKMVEYLDESPWVKFRPDAVIRSVGERGKEFTYFWKTDRYGFKNEPWLADKSSFTAIAIGDSFVEGMGVAVENTWESKLTAAGFPTYNLGVQGYAPVQILGSLKRWGRRFQSQYVLFGYFPGFEYREAHFAKKENFWDKKVFEGGIESINSYERISPDSLIAEKRRRYLSWIVLNTLIDLVKSEAMTMLSSAVAVTASDNAFDRAGAEIAGVLNGPRFDPERPEMKMTVQVLLESKRAAEEMGRKLVVVLFSQRNLTYYELLTGRPPADDYPEAQKRRYLFDLMREHQIEYIDLMPAITRHLRSIQSEGKYDESRLPYFRIDGHMTEIGHEIVAREVAAYFQSASGKSARKPSY